MSDYNDNIKCPELYKKIDKEAEKCIDEHLFNRSYDYMPDQEEMDNMVREVYRKVIKDYPEINNDPYENNRGLKVKASRKFYGRRRIADAFIWYVLIDRLDRRRRRTYRPYPRPYRPYNWYY